MFVILLAVVRSDLSHVNVFDKDLKQVLLLSSLLHDNRAFNLYFTSFICSSMSKSNWCGHPTHHQGDRPMSLDGPDKHQKERNRISTGLARFMNNAYSLFGSAKIVDSTSGLLCTSCVNFAYGERSNIEAELKLSYGPW